MISRESIKRSAPPFAKTALRYLREKIRNPPIDEVVLNDIEFRPDPSNRKRLNLLIPTLSRSNAYGGVLTGVELFLTLASQELAGERPDVRVIIDSYDDIDGTNVLFDAMKRRGLDTSAVEIIPARDKFKLLDTRRGDVFMAYNWWMALNIHKLLAEQASHFGCARRPLIYPIQDYEPHMLPFSSAHMLARQAYDADWPLWGVFNSSQLQDFFKLMGHKVEREYLYNPSLNDSLRPHLAGLGTCAKSRKILIYGRPSVERNCFSAVIRGLNDWATRFPQYGEWEIVSAGAAHKPIRLADGRLVEAVGKLALDEYATLLLDTAVGISLMASPHPSYPPLEMAHFGIVTITNGYTCKDLSTAHDNLVSIPVIGATVLGSAIAAACGHFEHDPTAGVRGRSHMPAFLAPEDFSFVETIARDLEAVLD